MDKNLNDFLPTENEIKFLTQATMLSKLKILSYFKVNSILSKNEIINNILKNNAKRKTRILHT